MRKSVSSVFMLTVIVVLTLLIGGNVSQSHAAVVSMPDHDIGYQQDIGMGGNSPYLAGAFAAAGSYFGVRWRRNRSSGGR